MVFSNLLPTGARGPTSHEGGRPMSVKDQVHSDLKEAMRAKDKVRLNAVRALRGEILKFEKSGSGRELTDEDALKMVKSLIKQRRDAIDQFTKGGREDLADTERAELEVLRRYLPEALGQAELAALVRETIAELGARTMKDMGKVMGALQGKVRATGKDADNRELAGMVKDALQ